MAGVTSILLLLTAVAGSGAAENAAGIRPFGQPLPPAADLRATLLQACGALGYDCDPQTDIPFLVMLVWAFILRVLIMQDTCCPTIHVTGGAEAGGAGVPIDFETPAAPAAAPDFLCAYLPGPPCDPVEQGVQASMGAQPNCGGTQLTTLSTSQATVYLDDRSGEQIRVDHWLYVESNGIPGLQRGGDNQLDEPDPCRESANPDRLLF